MRLVKIICRRRTVKRNIIRGSVFNNIPFVLLSLVGKRIVTCNADTIFIVSGRRLEPVPEGFPNDN